ncbi:hypothetical protein D3C87_1862970 [compost metagenome]
MTLPKCLYVEKFKKFMESIIILYLVDDEFKSICDDYCISKSIIEDYKGKFPEDMQRQAEYEILSLELEDDILKFIKKPNKEKDF